MTEATTDATPGPMYRSWLLPEVQLSDVTFEKVSFWSIGLRLLVWATSAVRFLAQRLNDRRLGHKSERDIGRRIRQMLERVGGTAVKLGQQLSIRVDMLPFEICDELDGLQDAVPPFKLARVHTVLEKAIGGPIDSVFTSIEETPIGSASIASVFRGTLHDGTKVAIKIRRPGVATEFQADLLVFNFLTRALEFLTLMRIGFFHHLRTELWTMLLHELDFRKEADLQHLFRQKLEAHKFHEATAPRVYMQWCSDSVMVSEYIEGLHANELLVALETHQEEKLKNWEAEGISARKVAKTLIELSFWGRFEGPFYHADPHPGNIIIRPGSQVVMLDFGACAQVPHWQQVPTMEFATRAMNHDYGGAAQMVVSASSPLPYVDVEELVAQMQDVFWRSSMVRYSDHCDWWERTSAAGWQKSVETLGDFNLQANAESVRHLRASLLYETLVSRLDATLDQDDLNRRWLKRCAKRTRRLLRRNIRRRGLDDFHAEWQARNIEIGHLLQAAGVMTQLNTARLPGDFRSIVSAGAYSISQILKALVLGLNLFVLTAVGILLVDTATGRNVQILDVAGTVAVHPITLCITLLLAFRTFKRINSRLLTDQVRRD